VGELMGTEKSLPIPRPANDYTYATYCPTKVQQSCQWSSTQQVLTVDILKGFMIYRLRLCMPSEASGLDDSARWSIAESMMESGPRTSVASSEQIPQSSLNPGLEQEDYLAASPSEYLLEVRGYATFKLRSNY
jgi:hypothetical protein